MCMLYVSNFVLKSVPPAKVFLNINECLKKDTQFALMIKE